MHKSKGFLDRIHFCDTWQITKPLSALATGSLLISLLLKLNTRRAGSIRMQGEENRMWWDVCVTQKLSPCNSCSVLHLTPLDFWVPSGGEVLHCTAGSHWMMNYGLRVNLWNRSRQEYLWFSPVTWVISNSSLLRLNCLHSYQSEHVKFISSDPANYVYVNVGVADFRMAFIMFWKICLFFLWFNVFNLFSTNSFSF